MQQVQKTVQFKRCYLLLSFAVASLICYVILRVRVSQVMTVLWQQTGLILWQETDVYEFHRLGMNISHPPAPFVLRQHVWNRYSIFEVFDQFRPLTLNSCPNVCNHTLDPACGLNKITDWVNAMLAPSTRFVPLMPEYHYVYPFEADYLSLPPLLDPRLLPNVTMSRLVLAGVSNGSVHCNIGDRLLGRVDLVDGYGNSRTVGGDEVRVWYTDKLPGNQFKAMGRATDIRNGSYKISIKCLWSGETKLNVAVAYPREYLRVVINQVHKGVTWLFAAKYWNSKAEEVTACSATPNILGRPCLCNLTSGNTQSLYCGRPLDSSLKCEDWIETYSLPLPVLHNVTAAEARLVQTIPGLISTRTIPHNVTVVVNKTGSLPALKPCSASSPRGTWNVDQAPTGYWRPGKVWSSFVCERPALTSKWAISCLKKTKVWIFGDSNGVRLFMVLSSLIKGTTVQPGFWPFQFSHQNVQHEILMTFTPHEYVLRLGQLWRKRMPYGSVAAKIDSMSSTESHVIFIHYYLHIASDHIDLVYFRYQAVHEAVARLVKRNPRVVVALRGPHVSSKELDFNHALGGDNLGPWIIHMVVQLFSDLRDHVIFLDGWELSLSLENTDYHPDTAIPWEMVRTVLAFKCPA